MHYTHLLAALIIGFVFTVLFSATFRKKGPWRTVWLTFFIITLASLSGQLWLQPSGPTLFGVALFPAVFIALLVTFTLAAISRLPLTKTKSETENKTKMIPEALGIFSWLLLLLLLVAVGVGYYRLT